MNAETARTLAQEIREVFQDVRRGGGTTLNQAAANSDFRDPADPATWRHPRDPQADRHWREIPREIIETLYDGFGFLDARGLRYYLPAFLIHHLENPESDWPVGDAAISVLARKDRIPDFSIFDGPQSLAIARFLQAVSLDWQKDQFLAAEAAAALRKYWTRFLPTRP